MYVLLNKILKFGRTPVETLYSKCVSLNVVLSTTVLIGNLLVNNQNTCVIDLIVYIFSDALERVAGIPAEKLVEAHGTLHTSRCINPECRKEYDRKWMTGNNKFRVFCQLYFHEIFFI